MSFKSNKNIWRTLLVCGGLGLVVAGYNASELKNANAHTNLGNIQQQPSSTGGTMTSGSSGSMGSMSGGGAAGGVTVIVASPQASPSVATSPQVSPSASPSANAVTVAIEPGSVGRGTAAFGENPLVIPMGTTITWTNNDSVPHTATSDTGVWDSGTLNPGQSYSFTFNEPGTFPYFCATHGQASMSGVIQVQ